MIKKVLSDIKKAYRSSLRERYIDRKRKKLTCNNVSVISSNCNGAVMVHDMNLQFNSPFVNLYMMAHDYVKMLQDFEYYMNVELHFIREEGVKCPVGVLDDVKIYFLHYKNEDDARKKWEERIKRIDYDNLYILFSDRDGCTKQYLIKFDNLPFKNKVVFVNKPYPDIKSAFYIK